MYLSVLEHACTTSADLPSFLSQYQGVGDPEEPDEFRKLARAVLRLEPRAEPALERDPFVGLQAYDSNKAHLFFGREKETDELVALLRETPLVLVTGDSGSGKSSLVLAGLVPAFRGGRLGRKAVRSGRLGKTAYVEAPNSATADKMISIAGPVVSDIPSYCT